MHYLSGTFGVSTLLRRARAGAAVAVATVAMLTLSIDRANAQTDMPAGMDQAADASAPPMTQSGGGNVDFFSQDLGTIFRFQYRTEAYGQDGTGNFDLGTMKVITFGDTSTFFDGQVTMNESDGIGFNLGVGYRWMNYPQYAPEGQMNGVSLWADGTHTDAGNFFPQVGVSLESLGEMWDVRANGYIPVGDQEQVGPFRATNQIGFEGNSISNITKAVVDRSYYVAELEFARRLGPQRDAWAFAGPYGLANDDEESGGFRVGVRGYAYPDLLLQFAVSDDDIFKTNATFSMIWFVGRTRTDFVPSGTPADNMRAPVLRNDYVALSHTNRFGGTPLTNPDGTAIVIRHFDSNAAAGGNGTFENPYNQLTQANGTGSTTGDILFAHSTSVFSGEASVLLKDNQRLLGEGNNLNHTITTLQKGTINIPESSPGARALARPQINAFTGDAITLADGNEVSNFDIDGQNVTARAIASPAGGSGNPNLNHLSIKNTTGDGISTTPVTITDPDDDTQQIVRGSVTIDTVTFDNVGGNDIRINAATTTDLTDPNVSLQEAIAISNVTSTNGNGAGVRLIDTHDTGTAAITNYANGNATAGSGGGVAGEGVLRFEGSAANKFAGDVTINNADIKNNLGFAYDFLNAASTTAVVLGTGSSWDGGTGASGGFRANNFNGTVNATSTTLQGGTLGGIALLNASDGTFNFASSVTLTNIGGTDVDVNGGAGDLFTGSATIGSVINNSDGRSVSVQGISGTDASVTLNGNITDTAQGILVNSNSGGIVLFAGNLDMDTTTNTAITVTDNTGTDIDFPGKVDIVTTTGDGFVATGGGTLTMSAANNTITTTTGQIAKITGMEISTGNVKIADVNRSAAAGTNAIQLENNTGSGSIDIGTVTDTAGQAGTIVGGTADAVLIRNSANVSVTGVRIDNAAGVAGVNVDKTNNNAMTVSLSDLEINDGTVGVQVAGHGTTGNLNMTLNDLAINDSTTTGLSFNDVDFGTINANAVNLDGGNTGGTADGVNIANSNASFTFNNATQIHEWSGDDFEVNGGTGTISFAGDIVNSSSVNPSDTSGRSIFIHNVSGGSVTFTADNTVDDTNQGILVNSNTGGTFNFNGDYNLNTGTNDAVTITNNNASTSISMGSLDIDTTSGQGFVATGGGTLSVTGTSNTITRTAGGATGYALNIEGMNIGAVDFESVNATGGAGGVRLVNNTGGEVTIGDTGNAVGQGGTIDGTADAGVYAENTNVTLNGVTVTNAGNAANENGVEILHTNATAMAAELNRVTVTNATPARDGVVIDGSGGSGTFTANVQNLNVNVSGDGLVVEDGVTLTAGGTNTITSDTGVGLRLTNLTIATANFQSVNVTNGATNGIRMENVTGGQVAITGTGTTLNSGGSITSAGDAILLSNVTNVDLSNMRVVDSSTGQGINIDHTAGATTAMDVTISNLNLDDSTGAGIDVLTASNQSFALRLLDSELERGVNIAANGSGHFGLLVDSTDIDTSTGSDVAFTFTTGGTLNSADVTFRNGNNFIAGDASALAITGASAAANSTRYLITGSNFTNNSAGSPTANIQSQGSTSMDITVQSNLFTNSNGAGSPFSMTSNGGAASILLNLGGTGSQRNSANGGAGAFTLTETLGDFNIFERDATIVTDTKNIGAVNTVPNDAAFDDSATAPTLPTVP